MAGYFDPYDPYGIGYGQMGYDPYGGYGMGQDPYAGFGYGDPYAGGYGDPYGGMADPYALMGGQAEQFNPMSSWAGPQVFGPQQWVVGPQPWSVSQYLQPRVMVSQYVQPRSFGPRIISDYPAEYLNPQAMLGAGFGGIGGIGGGLGGLQPQGGDLGFLQPWVTQPQTILQPIQWAVQPRQLILPRVMTPVWRVTQFGPRIISDYPAEYVNPQSFLGGGFGGFQPQGGEMAPASFTSQILQPAQYVSQYVLTRVGPQPRVMTPVWRVTQFGPRIISDYPAEYANPQSFLGGGFGGFQPQGGEMAPASFTSQILQPAQFSTQLLGPRVFIQPRVSPPPPWGTLPRTWGPRIISDYPVEWGNPQNFVPQPLLGGGLGGFQPQGGDLGFLQPWVTQPQTILQPIQWAVQPRQLILPRVITPVWRVTPFGPRIISDYPAEYLGPQSYLGGGFGGFQPQGGLQAGLGFQQPLQIAQPLRLMPMRLRAFPPPQWIWPEVFPQDYPNPGGQVGGVQPV